MSLLHERIRWVMQYYNLTQSEIARICGVKQPSVNRWVSGNTEKIKSDAALRLCKRVPIDIQWLISGIGSPLSASAGQKNGLAAFSNVAVPIFRLTAQADSQFPPQLEETQAPPKYYDQRWLTDHDLRIENLKVLVVPDNAMSPFLNQGDLVTIDTSKTLIENDRVFCFVYLGAFYVRRMRVLINGEIQTVSDGSWPDETIPQEKLNHLYILGRVVDRSGTSGL